MHARLNGTLWLACVFLSGVLGAQGTPSAPSVSLRRGEVGHGGGKAATLLSSTNQGNEASRWSRDHRDVFTDQHNHQSSKQRVFLFEALAHPFRRKNVMPLQVDLDLPDAVAMVFEEMGVPRRWSFAEERECLQSDAVLKRVCRELDLEYHWRCAEEAAVQRLRESLSLSQHTGSPELHVSTPEGSVILASTVRAYLDERKLLASQRATSAIETMGKRLAQQREMERKASLAVLSSPEEARASAIRKHLYERSLVKRMETTMARSGVLHEWMEPRLHVEAIALTDAYSARVVDRLGEARQAWIGLLLGIALAVTCYWRRPAPWCLAAGAAALVAGVLWIPTSLTVQGILLGGALASLVPRLLAISRG